MEYILGGWPLSRKKQKVPMHIPSASVAMTASKPSRQGCNPLFLEAFRTFLFFVAEFVAVRVEVAAKKDAVTK
jgi:hypothetical protein